VTSQKRGDSSGAMGWGEGNKKRRDQGKEVRTLMVQEGRLLGKGRREEADAVSSTEKGSRPRKPSTERKNKMGEEFQGRGKKLQKAFKFPMTGGGG